MAEESDNQSAGMKEFLEKAIGQLIELVVLLPAGGLLLLSIVWLWIDADIVPPSVRWLLRDSSTALVAMLIAASALGLLMFGWAAEGADAYLTSISSRHHWAVWIFHWMPVQRALETRRVQAALHSMAYEYTDVEASCYPDLDQPEPSRDPWPPQIKPLPGPWRSIARFTLLVNSLKPRTAGKQSQARTDSSQWSGWSDASTELNVRERQEFIDSRSQACAMAREPRYLWRITSELENLHLRVVLTLSVALASAVIAIEVVLRLLISRLDLLRLPPASQSSLIVIGLACVSASIGLRFLAGLLWREELELAVLLHERITKDAVLLRTGEP
jgi:hypothetical protein